MSRKRCQLEVPTGLVQREMGSPPQDVVGKLGGFFRTALEKLVSSFALFLMHNLMRGRNTRQWNFENISTLITTILSTEGEDGITRNRTVLSP